MNKENNPFLKNLFFISMSLMSISIFGYHAYQLFDTYRARRDLENYYEQKLEEVYTDGFALGEDGYLIWSQNRYESTINKLREEMLNKGFNYSQVARMHREGQKKGQATRRFWDEYKRQSKQSADIAKDSSR